MVAEFSGRGSNEAGLRWLPLGFPLGMRYDGTSGKPAPAVIRLGGALIEIAPSLYDEWMAIRVGGGKRHVSDRVGGEISSREIRKLEDYGMLLHLPRDLEETLRLLGPLLVTASGIGAGNSAHEPSAFVVMSQQLEPLAVLDRVSYEVWARAGPGETFAEACHAVASATLSIEVVTTAALTALPMMLASAVLFLEPSREGRKHGEPASETP